MRNADLDRRVSIEKHNAIDENKLPVKTRFSGCFYFILFFIQTAHEIFDIASSVYYRYIILLYNIFNIIQASFNSSPEAHSV